MNAIAWFFAGALVGVANVYLIARTVSQFRPEARWRALTVAVGGGLLRFGIAVVLLRSALQQSSLAGILAFAGLLMARWIVVYLLHSGRLAWGRAQRA